MRRFISRTTLTRVIFLFTLYSTQAQSTTFLFVGSYTQGKASEGIYIYRFDDVTGELTETYREDNIINPSYLSLSHNGQYLYSCTETQLPTHGSVSSFRVDSLAGKLSFINKQSAGGRNPIHVTVDSQDKYLINSNYTDPGISFFKIEENGGLAPYSELLEFEGSGPNTARQQSAHIHSSWLSPDNRFLYAPDLGADRIRVMTFTSDQLLSKADHLDVSTRPGSGPRHFTFHPNGDFAYCIKELSGTISAYNYRDGKLDWFASYFTYQNRHDTTYRSADVHITPNGKFLYASNRGAPENSLAIFKINQRGELNLVGHQPTLGQHPRNFAISPSGRFLLVANQFSNSVVVFAIDQKTGLLTETDQTLSIRAPSCLKMRTYGS